MRAKTTQTRIAGVLRQLRRERNMTLSALAHAAGLSQSYLSRVENHNASLTISALEDVAIALNVPMQVFFEESERNEPITICRAGHGQKSRPRGPRDFIHQFLAGSRRGKLMEPILVELSTGRTKWKPHPHAGEQFNYVIAGECHLIFGKERIHLRTGDAVYFDATVPHATWSIDRKPCLMVVVLASRDYLFHGDLRKLLLPGK
jgi:transcriptional regulator with XRE-family HTH domain